MKKRQQQPAHLLLQPRSVLHLLLQLFLEELTLRAGLLVLCAPVGVLVFQAGQRITPGVAVVPEIQLFLRYETNGNV